MRVSIFKNLETICSLDIDFFFFIISKPASVCGTAHVATPGPHSPGRLSSALLGASLEKDEEREFQEVLDDAGELAPPLLLAWLPFRPPPPPLTLPPTHAMPECFRSCSFSSLIVPPLSSALSYSPSAPTD